MAHDSETSQGIPIIVRQADPSLSIPSSYSTTPHGTIFSTTPGGTRIIYDRNALMHLRQSPLARTPPNSLCSVPGITKRFPASFHTTTTTTPSNHTHLKNSFSPPAVMSELHHAPNKQSHDLSVVEETPGEQLKGDSGEMFHMELE